ncbi:MAG: class I SAM-dependent methyltransferase [Synergistaceae bacterium]|jgi:ubiquinone/menaquinone biosynthesis C-methylase UbiE|nr:class I SAM-dependent methyltransferase [Synergistaceae bacterium]
MLAWYAPDACVGGFGLADRVVEYCGFAPGDHLADIGCGNCETANRLAARYGLYVSCVDAFPRVAPEISDDKVRFFKAEAEYLPFADSTFDGVMFECSVSLTGDLGATFREARRVLSPGGYLAVSDFESNEWLDAISAAGFGMESVHDCTSAVLEFWGQIILDYGLEEASRRVGFDAKTRPHGQPRYLLAVARRGGPF